MAEEKVDEKQTPAEPGSQEQAIRSSAARSVVRRTQDVVATPAPEFKPDLGWMNKTLQWGTRVKPGKKGLTVGSINVGIYGDIPDVWEDRTRRPRGAYPIEGAVAVHHYPLNRKADLWADNAADLYEEAIQRRWSATADVPWQTIQPLSEDIERAMCQLCTELSHRASVESEIVSRWFEHMAYGYHEVKLFLSTAVFDHARHFEVFRKRALANGGGLGIESPGNFHRLLLETYSGWSEVALLMYILLGTSTLTLYRFGQMLAHNEAEKVIFTRCMQDKARHITYAMMHVRYAVSHQRDALGAFHTILDAGEINLARDYEDPVLREALAILLGDGLENIIDGLHQVKYVRRVEVQEYLQRTAWIGLDRRSRLNPDLAKYLEPQAASAS